MIRCIKIIFIIVVILELLISTIMSFLIDSIIIGNYNENSSIYNMISTRRDLPENAIIKCIIKSNIVYRDNQYTVFYKTDKIYSTTISVEKTSAYIEKLDRYAIKIEIYCIGIIIFTIIIFSIILKKIKK